MGAVFFAATGADMNVFGTADHVASTAASQPLNP